MFTENYITVDDEVMQAKVACKLGLYGACLTGAGREGADNLVNATHELGVETVIGFDRSVNCIEMNAWAIAFFEALNSGLTIEQACNAADDVIKNTYFVTTTNSWYIAGNKTKRLRFGVIA